MDKYNFFYYICVMDKIEAHINRNEKGKIIQIIFDSLPITSFERPDSYIVSCEGLKLVAFSKKSEDDATEKLRIGLKNFLDYHYENGSLESIIRKLKIIELNRGSRNNQYHSRATNINKQWAFQPA